MGHGEKTGSRILEAAGRLLHGIVSRSKSVDIALERAILDCECMIAPIGMVSSADTLSKDMLASSKMAGTPVILGSFTNLLKESLTLCLAFNHHCQDCSNEERKKSAIVRVNDFHSQ